MDWCYGKYPPKLPRGNLHKGLMRFLSIYLYATIWDTDRVIEVHLHLTDLFTMHCIQKA